MSWALLGFTSLSTVTWAGPEARVYVDGVLVRESRDIRYTDVDVELGRDGVVRIFTRRTSLPAAPSPVGVSPASASDPLGSRPSAGTGSSPVEHGTSRGDGFAGLEGTGGSSDAPVDPRPLEERYWLAVQELGASPAEWAVEVSLNGQRVGEFASGEPRVVEVTTHLKRGANLARLEFRRTDPGGAKLTHAPGDALQVVLAPGRVMVDQDEISLSLPIFAVRRDATQDQGAPEELRFFLPPPTRP